MGSVAAVGGLKVVVLCWLARSLVCGTYVLASSSESIVNVIFFTHPTSEFQSSAALAEELSRRGHHVSLATTANREKQVPTNVRFINVGDLGSYIDDYKAATTRLQSEPPVRRSIRPLLWPTLQRLKQVYDTGIRDYFAKLDAAIELNNQGDEEIQQQLLPHVCVFSWLMESVWENCIDRHIPIMIQNPTVFLAPILSSSPQLPFEDILLLDYPTRPSSTIRNASLCSRLQGVIAWAYAWIVCSFLKTEDADLLKPHVAAKTIRMSHSVPGFDFAVDNSPLIHYTGPIYDPQIFDPSNVDEDTSNFLNDSLEMELPVVYVSFGTLLNLDARHFDAVLGGLLLGAGTLWRGVFAHKDFEHMVNGRELGDHVRGLDWVAGPAVLAHNATSVFFSNCGANGVHEAILHGKPILGMPFWGDQPFVCDRVEHSGVGKMVHHHTITPEVVRDALASILQHTAYRSHHVCATRLALTMKALGGRSRAADLIELVGRAGPSLAEMWQPVSASEGFIKAYFLDFAAAAVLIAFAFGFTARVVLNGCLQRLTVRCISALIKTVRPYRSQFYHREYVGTSPDDNQKSKRL